MTVWFTSDLHFGHRLVADNRGFADVADHDDYVSAQWAATVAPGDRVYILGDLVCSNKSLAGALDLLNDLPGEKHLIAGNHDSCHPMHRTALKALPRYHEAFASVQGAGRFKGYGIDVLLSHFPYTRDRDEPRFSQWRLPNLGAVLLHGHTHGSERATLTEDSREIHVGLDAWDLRPISVEQVASLIQ